MKCNTVIIAIAYQLFSAIELNIVVSEVKEVWGS